MKHLQYYCKYRSAPLRVEPSHRAEMDSELLFGEYVFGLGEETEQWMKVKVEWDDNEAWVLKHQLEPITDFSVNDVWFDDQKNSFYPLGSNKLGELASWRNSDFSMQAFISQYLGTPYYWGGRSQYGIDCSGLSQMYYKYLHIRIPRNASQQALCNDGIELSDANLGDLAFFVNANGVINHVGILLDSHRILHSTESQGGVVLDKIDSQGIISALTGQYSHHLIKIVHIVDNMDYSI